MRINALGNTATDFAIDDYIALDGTTNGSRKMKNDSLLKVTAQNALAGNVAQEFDPTKPNDEGGYAYYKDEIVSYQGHTYKFKVNHSSGIWNSAEVDRYIVGQVLYLFVVTDNPEYLFAVTDKDGVFLYGIKKDGSVEWQKGVPEPIKNLVLQNFEVLETELLSKVDKIEGKTLVESVFAASLDSGENPEYVKVVKDNNNNVIAGIKKDGHVLFFSDVDFLYGLKHSKETLDDIVSKSAKFGVGLGSNIHNESEISLPVPRLAFVDFVGLNYFPNVKNLNLNCKIRYCDDSGNYFEKSAVINAQGNSTLYWPKKNIAIDLFNSDGTSCKVKFGQWVEQDSFHLKANYVDFFRCVLDATYDIYKDIIDSRNASVNRTWKMAEKSTDNWKNYSIVDSALEKRVDSGALCFPQGFPVVVSRNGEFYGLFQFNLKKHRDNYRMEKSNKYHIHLDGDFFNKFFTENNLSMFWTGTEIRNPKSLYYKTAQTVGNVTTYEYDGDYPAEIAGSAEVELWIAAGSLPDGTVITSKIRKNLENCAYVKNAILSLYAVKNEISAESDVEEKKNLIKKYFDVDNLIDYIIFNDVCTNTDCVYKNVQWTTWDGVKWFANVYDTDCSFGSNFRGSCIRPLFNSHNPRFSDNGQPFKYILDFFTDELNARYAELRKKDIITSSNFIKKIERYYCSYGLELYEMEFTKWSNCNCNNVTEVADEWEIVLDENGEPSVDFDGVDDWDATINYQVGQTCVYFEDGISYNKYLMRCIVQNTDVKPIVRFGFKDSYKRLSVYIEKQIDLMDIVYNYNN